MLPLPSADELRRRLPRLLLGLVVMGAGIGSMAAADLGLGPWDVLHQGIARRTGLGLGALNILVGAVVLTLWVPLRQRLGVGTVLNTVVVGLAVDATLPLLPESSGIAAVRTAMEGTVLVAGWALGGTVGVGTVVLALTIGPLVQAFLGVLSLPPVTPRPEAEPLSSGTARP